MKRKTVTTFIFCFIVFVCTVTFVRSNPADFVPGFCDGVALTIAIDAWMEELFS